MLHFNVIAKRLSSESILENILSLILQIFRFLEAFECNTTSDWKSESEAVLHSNLQILEKKTKKKNALENGW